MPVIAIPSPTKSFLHNLLAWFAHPSDPCRDSGNYRRGRLREMSTSILEPQNTPQPSGSAPKAKLHHKARTAQSGKKSTPTNQGAKTRKLAAAGTRPGSKTAKVLHLLKRSGGATLKDLVKATGWQAHSV